MATKKVPQATRKVAPATAAKGEKKATAEAPAPETASAVTPVEAATVALPVAVVTISSIQIAPANLADLEQVIASGLRTFVDVGQALTRIRDGELYKATHATFEAYCAERWDMQRAHAYRLIEAAGVVENVSNWRQQKLAPPTVESHARELARLPPKEQPKAWAHALKSAPAGIVTAQHVAKVVTARLPEPASKLKRAKPAPSFSGPIAIIAPPADEASAIAEIESHSETQLLNWPWSGERLVSALENGARKARDFFNMKEASSA